MDQGDKSDSATGQFGKPPEKTGSKAVLTKANIWKLFSEEMWMEICR